MQITLQFQIQSLGFLAILVVTAYPSWMILKNSFILRIGEEKHYYWKWSWLIPCFTLLGNMITTMDGKWISTWQHFFARVLMIATVIASWKCINLDFEELDEKIRVKNENELLNLQIKSISDSAYLINERENKIKILRHDMRHQIHLLFSLISENEIDQALAMLKKLNTELSPISIAKFCQNPMINSAISIYAHKAISSADARFLPIGESNLELAAVHLDDDLAHVTPPDRAAGRAGRAPRRVESPLFRRRPPAPGPYASAATPRLRAAQRQPQASSSHHRVRSLAPH
jgi:hypothetical protein